MQFWVTFQSKKNRIFNISVKAPICACVLQPNLHLLWQIPTGIYWLTWLVEKSKLFYISLRLKFVFTLAHSHQNSYIKIMNNSNAKIQAPQPFSNLPKSPWQRLLSFYITSSVSYLHLHFRQNCKTLCTILLYIYPAIISSKKKKKDRKKKGKEKRGYS